MRSEKERRAGDEPFPRRRTDVVEDALAWLLGSLALLTALAAAVAGLGVHGDAMERARTEGAERTAVRAVLVADAELVARDIRWAPAVRVAARWNGPDGTEHTGPVVVTGPAAAGSQVTVWIDRDSRPTAAPMTPGGALAAAVVSGGLVAAAGGTVLWWAWVAVRRFAAARNAATWDREWARVEPRWSGRGR
jgi:hypothetical protein